MQVELRVLRFDPEKDQSPHFEDYTVTADPMDRLLDCLHQVKWTLDSSLALRRSCGHGVFGSDAMLVNGVNMLACKALVKDLQQPVTVEPIRGLRQLRDLIVDMEPFFAGYRAVMPWLVPDETKVKSEREHLQSPEERERFEDTTKCILCAACTTACPIFWSDEEYVGPAAIVNSPVSYSTPVTPEQGSDWRSCRPSTEPSGAERSSTAPKRVLVGSRSPKRSKKSS
jgi:succinate dehydrogenase / fumarate reductase, iron-sulfur subunit